MRARAARHSPLRPSSSSRSRHARLLRRHGHRHTSIVPRLASHLDRIQVLCRLVAVLPNSILPPWSHWVRQRRLFPDFHRTMPVHAAIPPVRVKRTRRVNDVAVNVQSKLKPVASATPFNDRGSGKLATPLTPDLESAKCGCAARPTTQSHIVVIRDRPSRADATGHHRSKFVADDQSSRAFRARPINASLRLIFATHDFRKPSVRSSTSVCATRWPSSVKPEFSAAAMVEFFIAA